MVVRHLVTSLPTNLFVILEQFVRFYLGRGGKCFNSSGNHTHVEIQAGKIEPTRLCDADAMLDVLYELHLN